MVWGGRSARGAAQSPEKSPIRSVRGDAAKLIKSVARFEVRSDRHALSRDGMGHPPSGGPAGAEYAGDWACARGVLEGTAPSLET